ncbi:amino acid adenylation domain-containing protein [Nocardiopsis flavescens]|uniref:non-ribosomal peptide synthetase n=2 Tax=Nocardiopsis flavescens TaxID=758803 RepID=UPI00366945DB
MIPLSYAQRRLWFLDRLEGPGATYNIPVALRLEGGLDPAALESALGDVVERHESLRTVFPSDEGDPYQRILPAESARPVLRVEEVAADGVAPRVDGLAREAFDLESEIPLHATLLRVGPAEHVLVLVVHHIAGDGWSMAPLLRDLSAAYRARLDGGAPGWEPLAVQYADYALWQQDLLDGEEDGESLAAEQLAHWSGVLAGLPDVIELPVDRARPARPSHRGGMAPISLPADLHRDLLALAQEHDATLFMVLQAALAATLTRMGSGTDVPLGTPVAGRGDEELEDLVGFFVNTLVLRTDTSGDPAFTELLGRVRERTLADLEHQDVPFDRLVEVLNPTRSTAHQPLFQVMVALQNNARADLDLPGLTASEVPFSTGTAKFDLTFILTEDYGPDGGPAGLGGALEYAADLFDAETAAALVERLGRVLTAVAHRPSTPIGDIDLLSEQERHRVLVEWNDTAAPLPEGSVVDLFLAQAAAAPDAVAVEGEAGSLTYAELERTSAAVAAALADAGVRPGDPVALAMERSVDLVSVTLGVLRAGALYAPLHASHPAERLALILDDCGARVLVADAAMAGAVEAVTAAGADLPVLWAAELVAGDRTAPDTAPAPRDSAYVMFTSGSTGRPKGVVVGHRDVVALAADRRWRGGAHERVLFRSPHAFDAATYELWVPLLNGGRVVVAPGETDVATVRRVLDRHRVTAVFLTTALFNLISEEDPALLAGVRAVLTGGEFVSPAAVARVVRACPDTAVSHVYGPTETTTFATAFEVPALVSGEDRVPIGRPLDNTRVYVLDERLRPVPVGVPGELYIAGEGVARGYLGRPDLTAERFVPDVFGGPGGRMYRTGDLVSWDRQGRIVFQGRVDDQVKVRGFRIELGEIEAHLGAHPSVGRGMVMVREDRPGDRRLVAYAVPAADAVIDPAGLRAALGGVLPDYMVPSAVVAVDALPLNANGKVDRRALPAPESAQGTGRAPRDAREEILCGLFAEVLGLESVTVDDSFFDLGGHSLLAARLTTRVRSALGAEFTLKDLFRAPTVARMAEHLAAAGASGAVAAPPVTAVAERPERVPLSYAQRRLWFLDRLEGPGAAYNIPVALRLEGGLDPAALRAALGDVVERHESLRTVFPSDEGDPYQRILPAESARPVLRVEEVAGDGVADRVDGLAREAFDLESEIPLHATLLRLGPDEHVLVLVVHHIAGDGWSMAPLLRDLSAAYRARLDGGAPGWEPLAVQYADYALWQDGLLADGEGPVPGQLAHWSGVLADLPDAVELPVDRARPARPSHRGGVAPVELPAGLHRDLLALARSHDATLFMVVQAALAATLTRMGAGTDVPLGTPVAGRGDAALEDLVGFFVNTLVLRTDTSGDPTFTELLERVRERTLADLEHQDVPFDRLVEVLNPVRSTAHQPLFQVMVALQNNARADLDLPGLTASEVPFSTGAAKFDLTFVLAEEYGPDGGPAGLGGGLEYAADLFDAETASALVDRLGRVLAAAAADPGTRVRDIPLLSEEERHRVLVEWNDTAAPLPEGSVVDLFLERAAMDPDAVAVEGEAGSLTYAELERASAAVAAGLADAGVRLGDRVALAMERSVDLVSVTLGVLRAGAVYVPLHASHPAERLALILDDCGARALVTDPSLAEAAAEAAGDAVPLLAAAGLLAGPGSPERVAVPPTATAYVMFTSGSTGRPKGVVVGHRDVVALAADRRWRGGAHERVLFRSPHAFDAATYELWVPLLNGGRVVVAPGETDVETLRRVLDRHEVTAVFLTTALFNLIAEEAPGMLSRVRAVLTGGEFVSPAAVARVLRACPDTAVSHVYGPTETTTFATAFEVPADLAEEDRVPIGRPLDNTRVYVLDERLRPVPVGVPGELYIAGRGVARGYLGRPDLTAERFLPDPFGAAGDRMYRTGDLVSWDRQGRIVFQGRVDDQVKVRGFRIELGEIEAVTAAADEVAQAVVLVHRDPAGERRLVAYAVPAAGAVIDPLALRARLGAVLPDYMVPAAVVVLEALPLNANAKVDRRALPEPDFGALSAGRAPRDAREEILCGLFAQVLGLESVTIDDSFFDLGGHSLLAARLTARVRTALGAEFTLKDLFRAPTVAEAAALLAAAEGTNAAVVRPLAAVAERPERVPLSYAQRRLWFLDRLEGPGAAYNIPVALRLEGDLDPDALRAALDDVVERHESLRTVFEQVDGEPYQRILPARESAAVLETAAVDPEGFPGALDRVVTRTFDLESEPPLHTTLLRLGPGEHVLVLVLHHIAGDGWSMAPLLRDLSEAYAARLGGGAPRWSPLAVQYADYALWQRDLLEDEQGPAAAQADHWRTSLAGIPDVVELPVDRARPARASHRGGIAPVELPAGLHRDLLALARRHHVTLFMVVQAALAALLDRMGAGDDVPLGTPVAGRGDEALDDLVGFFVNTLVLRTDTSGDPTFAELLARVREADLAAFAHQDLPFDRLVEVLNPVRSTAHQPLFQVMVALQNNARADLALPGLTASEVPFSTGTAKFDLTFVLAEEYGPGGEPAGLGGGLEYATDLFDAGTAAALVERLGRVLAAAAADPDARVRDIPLLSDDEREDIRAYNDTASPHRPGALVHELFEERVRETPDAVALVAGDERLTYAELDGRADRLARHLVAAGALPESAVAVLVDRSVHQLVATLAVVKCGAAYVPLAGSFPPARVRTIMAETGAAVLVTDTGWSTGEVAAGEAAHGTAVVVADDLPADPPDHVRPRGGVGDLALLYVMFTSGSTGRPKGVAVDHRNVVHLAADRCWDGDRHDRVMVHSAYGFDASTYEIWVPLLRGRTLVLAPRTDGDARVLADTIRDHGVTAAYFTTGLFNVMADECVEALALLKEVWTSGDVASPAAVDRVLRHCPGTAVVHGYGPTETTVWSSYQTFPVVPGDRGGARTLGDLTLGDPMDDTAMYVLDDRLRPVPPGATGELYVGGSHVARGYVGRSDLTSERFVADPYGAEGSRMYRTGDLVRWTPHKEVRFLGRVDGQLKIRGFRIEPVEVEAALAARPGIGRCAVVVREDRPGDKRLVAYVVPEPGHALDPAALRESMAESLPDYMIPSLFVTMDDLPLTGNGKLDRRALPAPDYGALARSRDAVTPREELVCRVFAEVLGLERVGVDDSFFDLGGHSLLATRLIGRINDATGMELQVKDLFRAPTVAGLLGGESRVGAWDPLLPIQPDGDAPPLFCIHPASGMAWSFSGLPRLLGPGQPVHGMQSPVLTGAEPAADVEALAADYLERIRSVRPRGPYRLLGYSFGGMVAHAVASLLQEDGEEVEFLALVDSYPAQALGPVTAPDHDQFMAMLLGRVPDPGAPGTGRPFDPAAAVRELRAADPVMAGFAEEEVAALVTAAVGHVDIAQRFVPRRHEGDVTFFQATLGRPEGAPEPGAWSAHVGGDIDVHRIEATHAQMTDPGPIALIGRVLAEKFDTTRDAARGAMRSER